MPAVARRRQQHLAKTALHHRIIVAFGLYSTGSAPIDVRS
jgi:hypothetical protein